jgi:hypothetical protein
MVTHCNSPTLWQQYIIQSQTHGLCGHQFRTASQIWGPIQLRALYVTNTFQIVQTKCESTHIGCYRFQSSNGYPLQLTYFMAAIYYSIPNSWSLWPQISHGLLNLGPHPNTGITCYKHLTNSTNEV